MLVVTDDQERVEAELAAGRVACPGCGGRLRPWGFGPRRVVRTSSGLEHVRARRAVCPACGVTHLLEPASTLPRMRDSAEVVGAAWQAKVDGAGYRSIAAKLGRPESTVRRWLRRLASRAGALRAAATDWLYQFDPSAPPLEPAGSPLADALESVGRAVAAASSRLGPRPPWPTAVTLTGGLVASWGPPPACLPPG